MISEITVMQSIEEFFKNEDWKKAFLGAPAGAQLRMELAFWFSFVQEELTDEQKDEYREFREALEDKLAYEDLKYLAESVDLFPENTKEHYRELMSKRQPKQDSQSAQNQSNPPLVASDTPGEGGGKVVEAPSEEGQE